MAIEWKVVENFNSFTNEIVERIIDKFSSEAPNVVKNFEKPLFKAGFSYAAIFSGTSKSIVLIDGFQWYRKQKGHKEVKPRKRTVNLANNKTVTIWNCNIAGSDALKKYIIIDDSLQTTVVIYVATGPEDSLKELQPRSKPRLLAENAKRIREALEGRTIKSTMEYLKEKKISATLKQVTNQSRAVNNTVKMKRGPRPVTNPADFTELSRVYSSASFQTERSNFRFIYLDENLIALFVKSLPSLKKLNKYRLKLENIETWTTEDLNSHIESCEEYLNGGTDRRMPHLQYDTTFDISSCYVTILSGSLSKFQTKSSGKTRHSILGFMMHNSKDGEHHAAFGKSINKIFEIFDPKCSKRVPSVLHDGEAAFEHLRNGVHFEESVLLRCDLHRRSNIERYIGTSLTDKEVHKLFGKTDSNRYFKKGILNSLSMASFTEKLENSTLSVKIRNWLSARKDELLETHGLKNRMYAGFIIPNVRTNSIENINSKVKVVLNRPESGLKCAEKLIKFVDDEFGHVLRSAQSGDDEYVKYSEYDEEYSTLSIKDKVSRLLKIGFTDCVTTFMDIPLTLKPLISVKNVNDVLMLEVKSDEKSYLVQLNSQVRAFTEVRNDNGDLCCANLSCNNLPQICRHVVAVLLTQVESNRQKSIEFLVKKFENYTVRQSERALERRGQAKRFKRKYTHHSRHNNDRTILGILPDSPNTGEIERSSVITEESCGTEENFMSIFQQNASSDDQLSEENNVSAENGAYDQLMEETDALAEYDLYDRNSYEMEISNGMGVFDQDESGFGDRTNLEACSSEKAKKTTSDDERKSVSDIELHKNRHLLQNGDRWLSSSDEEAIFGLPQKKSKTSRKKFAMRDSDMKKCVPRRSKRERIEPDRYADVDSKKSK